MKKSKQETEIIESTKPKKKKLKFGHLVNIIIYIVYIISLTNNIRKGSGVPMLNYVLLGVSIVFLLIYVIMALSAKESKKEIKSAKRYYKWFKLGMKGVSLFIAIYGFVSATESQGSMIVPLILICIWLIQVSIEVSTASARIRRAERKKKREENVKAKQIKRITDADKELQVQLKSAKSNDISLSDE